MPKKPPQLAKFTRPRLHKAVARERLFAVLDEKRDRPCVWISGPPGAGKTTLVASYLNTLGTPALWYQIDPGDTDPATFFYYLREAVAAQASQHARRLPLLTPEYLTDLPGFARRFFRGAFAALGSQPLLVFDNYHDLARDAGIHDAFAACLEEVPQQANIITISRTDPPPAFARALINRSIARVDWEDLRLTKAETAAIANARGISVAREIEVLHEQSSGWMAGVVLLSEGLRSETDIRAVSKSETLETVFEYFAGQILNTIPGVARNVLIRTAMLPRVTAATAEAVTGVPDAIAYVEQLYRRRLFTDRTSGAERSYQYHALFRAFLRARAQAELSDTQHKELLRRGAEESERSGDIENAFALYVEAGGWREAERMFTDHAGTLIGQGRWKTLEEWGGALPEERRQDNPWIGFWLGRSMTAVDPSNARELLDAAFRIFLARADEKGQLLCGAGVLEALYYQYNEFREMDGWILSTAQRLERRLPFTDVDEELWVNSVFMVACAYRSPGHPLLPGCAVKVAVLLPHCPDVNLTLTAATMLHFYASTAFDVAAAELATRQARPLLSSSQLTAQRAALYLAEEGYSRYIRTNYVQALECCRDADQIAQANGLLEVSARINHWRGFCERRAGLLPEAEATIRRLEGLPRAAGGIRPTLLDALRSYIAFDRGEIERALELALPSLEACEATGQMLAFTLMRIINANILIAAGRFERAESLLELAWKEIDETVLKYQRGAIALNRAWLAHRSNQGAKCEVALREMLALSSGEGERTCMRWYPKELSELLPLALDRCIDADAARKLVRECNVMPGAHASESWPWPVKVYTLGRFDILLSEKSPEYSRKSPKRVLTLLKTIIAFGGTDVPEQRVIDAIWPDQEGDAGHKALSALLHRLRALLNDPDCIRHRGGKISMNREKCWVDVDGLEQCVQSPDTEAFKRTIELYRGEFLAQDEDASWAVAMRERMRGRFIGAVARFASALEQSDRWEDALQCYTRGIEIDNLVEPFYQGLMRCYSRLDRRAEVAGAYQRLRQALSIRLGSRPSTSTERLYQSLRPE